MSIGDKLKKKLEQLDKAKQAPEEKADEQAVQNPAEQYETPAKEYKTEQDVVKMPRKTISDLLAAKGIESKSLEQEVDELISQANSKTSDSDDITRLKEGIPIYATTMPAITYDHIIIILKDELNVYKDVHEGDIYKFEKLVLLEREWKSTKSLQKREEFYFALMQLQEEYKPEYTGELALAYLRNIAKGEKK